MVPWTLIDKDKATLDRLRVDADGERFGAEHMCIRETLKWHCSAYELPAQVSPVSVLVA